MNFERAFNRLLIGDKITCGEMELHYLHPFSFETAVFAVTQGELCQWITWNNSDADREEIKQWLWSHCAEGLGGDWKHRPGESNIALWDEPIKYMLIPVGHTWIYANSPFTGEPRSLYIQRKTRAYEIGAAPTGDITTVWYRNGGHGTIEAMYRVGGVCAIRPRSRATDIGFVRINSIRYTRIGLLEEHHARAAGFVNLACFMQVWSQRHRSHIQAPVFLYDLTGVSRMKADGENTPTIRPNAYQLAIPALMERAEFPVRAVLA